MNVRDVQLNNRPRKHLQGVKQRERGERVGGRIDNDAATLVDRFVDPLDQLGLAVCLSKLDGLLLGFGVAHRFNVRERRRAIDVRLTRAEPIEVWTVENVDRFGHEIASLAFMETVIPTAGLVSHRQRATKPSRY